MTRNKLLRKNTKLTSIDNVNKLLLTSLINNFEIKKINFKFFSKDFVSTYNTSGDNALDIKINSLTMLYLILGVFSSITSIKQKTMKKSDYMAKEDLFSFNTEILNKNSIHDFLLKLNLDYDFFENNLNLDNLNNISIQNRNVFSYNTKICTGQIFEQQEFFTANNFDCNVVKNFVSMNFIFNIGFKYSKINMTLKDFLFYKMQYL